VLPVTRLVFTTVPLHTFSARHTGWVSCRLCSIRASLSTCHRPSEAPQCDCSCDERLRQFAYLHATQFRICRDTQTTRHPTAATATSSVCNVQSPFGSPTKTTPLAEQEVRSSYCGGIVFRLLSTRIFKRLSAILRIIASSVRPRE
jgi:hypothetical protein